MHIRAFYQAILAVSEGVEILLRELVCPSTEPNTLAVRRVTDASLPLLLPAHARKADQSQALFGASSVACPPRIHILHTMI